MLKLPDKKAAAERSIAEVDRLMRIHGKTGQIHRAWDNMKQFGSDAPASTDFGKFEGGLMVFVYAKTKIALDLFKAYKDSVDSLLIVSPFAEAQKEPYNESNIFAASILAECYKAGLSETCSYYEEGQRKGTYVLTDYAKDFFNSFFKASSLNWSDGFEAVKFLGKDPKLMTPGIKALMTLHNWGIHTNIIPDCEIEAIMTEGNNASGSEFRAKFSLGCICRTAEILAVKLLKENYEPKKK
jgi:hypothetical protein